LEKIEIAIRTRINHELSTLYDAFWIDDAGLFTDADRYQATIAKIAYEYSRSDEEFLISFRGKYTNPLPPSFMSL
jgi:abortive infection bacteriophage resistance protein